MLGIEVQRLALGLAFGNKLNSECLGSRKKNMEAILIAELGDAVQVGD